MDDQLEPRFAMHGLHVRYHPNDAASVEIAGCETTLVGIIGLKGFTSENAAVMGCYFEADTAVPGGQVIFEPMSGSHY